MRAKFAEVTKGKDRLGRNLRFNSFNEDTDFRLGNALELDTENDKDTIKIIMSQAEENFKQGSMNKEQYNTLMFQVMQINERLKLKEAKQRESLEESKRKLNKVHCSDDESETNIPLKNDNTFGDIDERITPIVYRPREPPFETPDVPIHEIVPNAQDSDLRVNNQFHNDMMPPVRPHMPDALLPRPPMPPLFPVSSRPPMWRGPRSRTDDFSGPRGSRLRVPPQPFFRGKFDSRGPRNFEPLMPLPLPPPMLGMFIGDSPLEPYNRPDSPPPLGTPGIKIPPADNKILEYIDRDLTKTIEIDGISREIRFYGETAVVMLDWDNPREIRFLPGSRRITFDNKDSVVLMFNEGYTKVEVDDQEFNIRFGAPTRELYINDRWYECLFGGPPHGIIIDGVPRVIQLEGPPPQVDIRLEKRTDLVAGKINMIVDATHMYPVFLDAKPQKFLINNTYHTIRFVDSLRTVLINEVPFKVEFGGLPRPVIIGKTKHFIRFSVLPRSIKPGQISIANMDGRPAVQPTPAAPTPVTNEPSNSPAEVPRSEELPLYERVLLSPEGENSNPGNI